MQCCVAKLIVHTFKVGRTRPIELATATLEKYCGTEFEDLHQFVKQLSWERVSPVNQQNGTAEGVQTLYVPLPLDRLKSSTFGLC